MTSVQGTLIEFRVAVLLALRQMRLKQEPSYSLLKGKHDGIKGLVADKSASKS